MVLIMETHIIFVTSQNERGLELLPSDARFMNTCSFITPFKETGACSKVSVKCMICFDEFKEASSSS